MGCRMSTEDTAAQQRNREIESQLKRDLKEQQNEIKMLLLGEYFYTQQKMHADDKQVLAKVESQRFSSR
jgi:hypothetical protein